MMKYGNFYEILGNDALIMNKLLNYKISKLSNTFKVVFPTSSLENIINKLNNYSINCIVIDKEKIENKKEFEFNNYNNYQFDENIINYNLIVISGITKYLTDNILKENISSKLETIKEIINEQ